MLNPIKTTDFDAIRLKLASPQTVMGWSHGEVTKPETINYRTQKPEKSGLFAEEIFGPSKDWECYCGKYKKIRYKGIVCDKCGVEVTRALVRRERMGHIALAAPVTHIWFLRGVPSKIGLLLDTSVQSLEKVIYFANFVVLSINEQAKGETLEQIREELKAKRRQIEEDAKRSAQRLSSGAGSQEELEKLRVLKEQKFQELETAFRVAVKELEELSPRLLLSEMRFQELSLKYGHLFEAGIGAEAIHALLSSIDLPKEVEVLQQASRTMQGAKRDKALRRLKLLQNFLQNNLRPEWMVLTMIPVIPPDLRPMVSLDGGRFATSDLNDLYRRVINRNNRLKQLIELNAPEVICRNEKRMLQEAVDALIDNSARQGKTVVASTGQKRMLKSLADVLKGKQGRFRQNLLGKRTDYSGRSVIVVGPHLKLHQCGLPKKMALELFKPFVISRLIRQEIVHNVRSASRTIEAGKSEVWDILEDIVKDAYVLLNRAPTLHRLGIQAFQPVLIEGKAIQVHPMVCTAFNADFDGDQMAVHLPLTEEAKMEARDIMLSSRNLLKPATGDPVVTPTQDLVWGCYYMTGEEATEGGKTTKVFASKDEAVFAYELGHIRLREQITVRFAASPETKKTKAPKAERITTTVGRLLFYDMLPSGLPYPTKVVDKKGLEQLVRLSLEFHGREATAVFLDRLKDLSLKYLTRSGLSWGRGDLPKLTQKVEILGRAESEVEATVHQYEEGLLTQKERRAKVISIWTHAKDEIVKECRQELDPKGSVHSMIESGARGNWAQLTQIIGMKGLVTNPSGEIIELPIKGSFQEGFDVLEYFISTHGARKGLSDTALRTANAGYLTRRLVDVAQDTVVLEEDCGDPQGFTLYAKEYEALGRTIADALLGRTLCEDVVDEKGKTIVAAGTLVTEQDVRRIKALSQAPASSRVRSVLNCRTRKGVCQRCYGADLGYNNAVALGTAVGIIAAQSIGEPGTQLTMRTFHTGGIVGQDITQGLPRVEELFECRSPARRAYLAGCDGIVDIVSTDPGSSANHGQKVVRITSSDFQRETFTNPLGKLKTKKEREALSILVADGDTVASGAVLAATSNGEIRARLSGVVRLTDEHIEIITHEPMVKEYLIPNDYTLIVRPGQTVEKGQQLTEGSIDLHELYNLRGKEVVERYIIKEIQYIYSTQGQKLNDKHIEVIVRQLFSRVTIIDPGSTTLLGGDLVEKAELEDENRRVARAGEEGTPATAQEMLLGITKVSLTTRSFLSAASFQETARVLINAAVTGKVDTLEGLKENVIIGRLIPVGTGFWTRKHPKTA